MGMRRHMRAAAAASILFLAGGTGAAHAATPFSDLEAELAGLRVKVAVGWVNVEVTEATISDRATDTLTIKWVLDNVDASIADLLSGYCARAKVNDGSWHEECFSEVPDSTQTFPVVTTRYHMSMTNDDWPEMGSHKVTAQVKMKYDHGDGVWTSWSPEYDSQQRF